MREFTFNVLNSSLHRTIIRLNHTLTSSQSFTFIILIDDVRFLTNNQSQPNGYDPSFLTTGTLTSNARLRHTGFKFPTDSMKPPSCLSALSILCIVFASSWNMSTRLEDVIESYEEGLGLRLPHTTHTRVHTRAHTIRRHQGLVRVGLGVREHHWATHGPHTSGFGAR